MPQADVLAFVQLMGNNTADATAISTYYTDVVRNQADLLIHTNFAFTQANANDPDYDYPTNAVRVIAIWYDDYQLEKVSLTDLEAVNPRWRDKIGRPKAYTEDDATRSIFLYPMPDVNGDSVASADLGANFPRNDLTWFYVEAPTNVLQWLELTTAMDIIYREYSRDSDHKDLALAGWSKRLRDLLIKSLI